MPAGRWPQPQPPPVDPGPEPPLPPERAAASFTISTTDARVGEPVRFDGARSRPYGAVTYVWDVHETGNIDRSTESALEHTYQQPGLWWVVLVVRSTHDGTADTAATQIEVLP